MTKGRHSRQERRREQQQHVRAQANVPRPAAIDSRMGLLDIVMPIYGEWNLAEQALDKVAAATIGLNEGYRVIVVDNGTPPWKDGQGHEVTPEQQAIAVRDRMRPGHDLFFRIDPNSGYPHAVNECVKRGFAPLILILTADVFMEPGSITRMVRALDDPQVGVVGPLLIFPEGTRSGPPGRVQHAGICFNIRGKTMHQFIGWTPENAKVQASCDVAAVTGACFLTRRSLWRQIGGFYEGYGKGTFEDIEYCFAVRAAGAKVLYLAQARGYHFVGGSFQAGASRGTGGFNLPMNEAIFNGRWAHMLVWDEWRRL